LSGSGFAQYRKYGGGTAGVDAVPRNIGDKVLVRGGRVVLLPKALAFYELIVIANLPEPQDLLQDADVVLHHLVLVRQIVELGFGLVEELVVDTLLLLVKLEISELVAARREV
jgi:hypothetical protein